MYKKMYEKGLFGFLNTDGLEAAWIIDGGIETRNKEQYFFDNARRPGYGGYLIQYTLEGRGCLERDGVCYEIGEGKGFLVSFPENSAYYLPEKNEAAWTFAYLHFDGNALLPYMERMRRLTNGIFSLDPFSKSIGMLMRLQERMRKGEKLKKYENSEFIFSFVCTLLREIEEADTEKNSSLVKKAAKYLENEYREIESIQALAEQLGITAEHFCRIFKKEMHVSPGQYLTQLRIQASMYDLLNTKDKLEVIAQNNGFANANYYEKVFKKQVGVTPTQYRSMS